jgi:hypothetical protein
MRILKLAATAAMLGIASIGLAGCATGFPAKVSRYQAMPAPAGQSFYILPFNGPDAAGLEFNHYASMVSDAMRAYGYAQAPTPAAATMLVRLGYGVDEGRQEIVSTPYARSMYGDPFFGGFYGRPYYSRWGYGSRYGSYGRSPFYYGWEDPFWYGDAVRTYTVYVSHLDLDIRRRVDNAPLFEGHAKARSRTDELNQIVPNLVEAMFTGFPGRSGETIKITVPPPTKRAS